MAITGHSREALAAQRFFEATRKVDRAFRAVRGDRDEHAASVDSADSAEYAAAQSRLDLALDELARAQELFDSAVSVRGTRHY